MRKKEEEDGGHPFLLGALDLKDVLGRNAIAK